MRKTLTKHGDSLALVTDKPMLELLKVDAGTPLEITTDGDALIVQPIRDGQRQERLDATLERLNRRLAPALKELAD
jgi:antitoxin MazE